MRLSPRRWAVLLPGASADAAPTYFAEPGTPARASFEVLGGWYQ